ncbi:RNA polymerase sigma factor [Putridiphycobacter roseus]|uniref:RNA polymerase sigma factor n=1 Tax=Putridiphycobacter roseus TaxID=2219161 RepID=UPI001313DBBA|nr:RNA polymerase sigma factor [Putridiphycobacter roseus]
MNRKEYNTIVKTLSGRLFGYCVKYLQSKPDADDIVQDVFEKLWNNRKKVDFEKSKSWLFTTAHNTMLNYIKRRNRISYVDEVSSDDTQVCQIHQFELKEIINHSLEILPPVQKSIILLRDLEGYDYKEIGEILELSESQVKVYLFRARNKMKKRLKNLNMLEVKHA